MASTIALQNKLHYNKNRHCKGEVTLRGKECGAGGNRFGSLTVNLHLQWSRILVFQIILATPLSPYSSLFFSFSPQNCQLLRRGGSVRKKSSPRAAKLVLTSTGAYLGFPVGPAGWCSRRFVEGCSQPGLRGASVQKGPVQGSTPL